MTMHALRSVIVLTTGVKHKARGQNPARRIISCGPRQLERHVITFLKEIEETFPVLLF